MTKRIFRSIFLVAMAVFVACMALIMGVLYNYYDNIEQKQLKSEMRLAADGVELSGMEYLRGLDGKSNRLTWVDPEGKVLFDSQTDASKMENHADRVEIRKAYARGEGYSSRYSSTLTEQTLYYAQRLEDGSVLRISVSRYTILAIILSMLTPFIVILAVAFVLSLILANRLSKKIVKPLEDIDLERPFETDTYDELAPMMSRIEQQHRQIRRQGDELRERKNEFAVITDSMKEGLVLLSGEGRILSINPAARDFFGLTKGYAEDYEGEDFLSIERERHITSVIDEAKARGSADIEVSRNGREYQLGVSRVETDGKVSGVVMLIVDVTDKVFAERNRREFTANVSHDLKTPLHSIIGSAELLENGLVKTEDVPRFVGHIHSEAIRLENLTEDIIRLSQLDENAEMPKEKFNVYDVASEVVELLKPLADERKIAMEIEGEHVTYEGPRQLLQEVIYNLCDNAIKYNVEEGSVKITIGHDPEEPGKITIDVSDTGIGIPPESQDRIFERFYRVDKSHSKKIGGTGLGLSIVKHAVQSMGGEVSLESAPGEGTSIKVSLT